MCPLLLISPHIANLGNEVASEGSTLTTHAAIPHLVNKVNRHICRSMALHFLEEAFIHLVPPSVPEAIQEENGINIWLNALIWSTQPESTQSLTNTMQNVLCCDGKKKTQQLALLSLMAWLMKWMACFFQ